MPVTSTATHGDEREAAAARDRQVKTATSGAVDAPATQIRERAAAGGFGMLSLTALLFSMIKEVEAADPNVTFLDDDTITYKDLAHGVFELTTKEPTPRHIIVEDPGQTVMLSKVGSGLTVNQFDNSATRMEELRAVQQEALENFAKGFGTNGSGTPPFVKSLLLEPINFIAPDAPAAQNTLPSVTIFTVPEILIVRTPPTLNAQAPALELDTAVFDVFTATRGTFSASSSSSNAALTFAISGGATGDTVLDGATYDLSKISPYGTLYLNSTTGAYAFVPDNGAINALKTSTTDSFVISVSDGSLSAEQAFTININGVDDAAIISGTTTGTSIESGGLANAASGPSVTTGKLSDVDVDDPANTFTAVNSPTPSAHGYGTFTMNADGVWAYTLDQSNSAVQALNIGETLTDTFTVTSIGGTPQLIIITINGSNDAAIISGTATGTVTEAACGKPGTPTATGRLTDTDVDNTPDKFTPVTSPRVNDHGFGSFQMTADGVWTYTLDNANCAVQALNDCDTLTDTFTVTTIDGTAQVVTITIRGTNDPAIIRGCTTGWVTEPDCEEHGKRTASGRLTDTDVDNPPNTFTPVTCATRSAGGYGTFTMTAAGVWTYSLDTTNCAVKALSSCDTLTDTFTVTTIDGTEQTIAITIHGAEDRDDFHDHFGPAAARDAASPPHAAAIAEDNTAAYGFAAVQTVAAGTNDARTDDTAVSGESPDDGKFNSQDGCDARFGGHEWNLLASSSGDDHFVFASTSNPGVARPDIVSGFKADSERIDLTALGALTFAVLALDSSSTTVPAHTIGWLYDSSANQTVVYVNSTDQVLGIGDSSLVEIHLNGFSTVETSNFILAPETSGHAMGAEPVNLEAGAGSGATDGPTTATTTLSSDEITHERTAQIDGHGSGQAAKTSGCPFDADCERIILVEHTQDLQSDDTKSRLETSTEETGATSAANRGPPVSQLHPKVDTEDRFVFDKPAPFDSGKESAFAREIAAAKDGGPATSSPVDRSNQSSTDPIETSDHENQLLEHHHRDPTGENNLSRFASVRLGDSFHFKQPAPESSDVLAPEPRHAAAEPYATRDGALHDHPSGHHEHAGVIHGFGAAPMPEWSPLHIDPTHWAGSASAHVPHDLIV